MKDIVEKLLDEVEPDIKEVMLKFSSVLGPEQPYRNWELLDNPVPTIIAWQDMRNKRL